MARSRPRAGSPRRPLRVAGVPRCRGSTRRNDRAIWRLHRAAVRADPAGIDHGTHGSGMGHALDSQRYGGSPNQAGRAAGATRGARLRRRGRSDRAEPCRGDQGAGNEGDSRGGPDACRAANVRGRVDPASSRGGLAPGSGRAAVVRAGPSTSATWSRTTTGRLFLAIRRRRVLDEEGKRVTLPGTKGGRGITRVVPLLPELVPIVESHRTGHPSHPLFPSPQGFRLDSRNCAGMPDGRLPAIWSTSQGCGRTT